MAKITTPDKQSGQTHSAQEYNAFKGAVNELYEGFGPDGKILLTKLPDLFFGGLNGSGTEADPFVVNGSGAQASAEEYLMALPGFQAGVEKILYGGGLAGFSWGPIPSGTLEKLGNTLLTLGTASVNSIPLSWTGITDAQFYSVQRSENEFFNNAVVVYNGSALNFSESDLITNTIYYYRVRAMASGFAPGNWSAGSKTTLLTGNITPPAPTSGVVNDNTNTFDWTNSVGYQSINNYEYTIDGGNTYSLVTVKPVLIGNLNKAIGQVGVRVKSEAGRTVSATLFNSTPFSKPLDTPAAPVNPVTDNTADFFDWTYSPGFSIPSNYEITLNAGTSWSTVTEKPYYVGNVAKAIAEIGVRVKAVPGVNNNSATLFNSAPFTVALAATVPVTTWRDAAALTINSNSLISIAGDNDNYAWASSSVRLPAGGSGFVMFDLAAPNAQTSNGIFLGLSAGASRESNASMSFRIQGIDNNRIIGGKNGQYPISPSLPISTQSRARMRADGINIYSEYSTDAGASWTILNTGAQPASDLYVKVYTDTPGQHLVNVVQSGLTVG